MAYRSNSSSHRYTGDGGGSDHDRRSDRGKEYGSGYGGGHPPSRGGPSQGPKKTVDPYLMQIFFMSERKHNIHRDVLKIRIRHHLGNAATSWFGQNQKTGEYGHFYRAERAFTPAELEDLEISTSEYVRDPEGFQRRLDRTFLDHSQWTDPGELGYGSSGKPQASYAANKPGYSAGYPQGSQPLYTQSEGAYMPQPNDPYSVPSGYGQHQTQDSTYGRKGKSKHSSGYDYQGDSGIPASRGGAYGGGYSTEMSHADDTGFASYGAGNSMSGGYSGVPMDPSASYSVTAAGAVAGTQSGAYADQFLDTMPAPGGGSGYNTNYGQGSSSNPDCPVCKKKSSKCKCPYGGR